MLPVGTVISYLGKADSLTELERNGWLLCDGRKVASKDYPILAAYLMNTFGSEKDKFGLPDLRGMFLRGVADQTTQDPDYKDRLSPISGDKTVAGPVVGSRQSDQLKNHFHNWDRNFGQIGADGSDLNVQMAAESDPKQKKPDFTEKQQTTLEDGGGKETRPRNVYVYYLIFAGSPSDNKSA